MRDKKRKKKKEKKFELNKSLFNHKDLTFMFSIRKRKTGEEKKNTEQNKN